jgi:DNA-binding transcriptional regulator LsrR (DeoR family)
VTQGRFTAETTRLDDAARAGWLYYVAGNTQDEIAKKLNVSRQTAQRLVSLAVAERLVKVRLDHPIGRCMDLAGLVTERFALRYCEIVPSDPDAPGLLTGVAIAAATEIERVLKSDRGRVIALGTGRALKDTVEQLPRMACPQHRIVSLLGNMMSDGSATPYNATIAMAERVGARHYPYPLPVLASDPEELAALRALEPVRNTVAQAQQADLTLVGIGQMGRDAPLVVDGFVPVAEMDALVAQGAAGEITSWIYDRDGHLLDCEFNTRVASVPLPKAADRRVIAVAVGEAKRPALSAALTGRLVNGLITNEVMAERLLAAR